MVGEMSGGEYFIRWYDDEGDELEEYYPNVMDPREAIDLAMAGESSD